MVVGCAETDADLESFSESELSSESEAESFSEAESESEIEEGEEKKQEGCCPGPKPNPGREVLQMLAADPVNSQPCW